MELDRYRIVADAAAAFELVDVQRRIEQILLDVGEEGLQALGRLSSIQLDSFDRLSGCFGQELVGVASQHAQEPPCLWLTVDLELSPLFSNPFHIFSEPLSCDFVLFG